MTNRKPLVYVSGAVQEMPAGDTLDTVVEAPIGMDTGNWGYPAVTRGRGSRFDITDFAGATAVLNTPLASQNWAPVMNKAVSEGVPLFMGRDGKPLVFNFVNAAPVDGDGNIVALDADVSVDVVAHKLSQFNMPTSLLAASGGNLFRFKCETPQTSHDANPTKFSWIGGIFSGRAYTDSQSLTRVYEGFASGCLSIAWFYKYLLEDVQFDGGIRPHFVGTGTDGVSRPRIGGGAVDTLMGINACGGGEVNRCQFLGAFDEGTYWSGAMQRASAAANPISTVNGSRTVTVKCSQPHGLFKQSVVGIGGVSNGGIVAGLNVDGRYVVQETPTTTTFEITSDTPTGATLTVAAGGGSGVGIAIEYADALNMYLKPIRAPANPISFSAANTTATITTSAAHGLAAGAVVHVSQATAVSGIKLVGRYVVQSVPSATTLTVTSGTVNATGTGSGGGTGVRLNLESQDYKGGAIQGMHDKIQGCTYAYNTNAATYKRNGNHFDFVGNYLQENGGGFLSGTVSFTGAAAMAIDPLSAAKQIRVMNNDIFFTQGYPVNITGDNSIVSGNKILGFGKTLVSLGVDYTPASTQICGILLNSGDRHQVHDNIVEQPNANWRFGTPAAAHETVGIGIRYDDRLRIPVTRANIHDNNINFVDRPVAEFESKHSNNIFRNNVEDNYKIKSAYNGVNTLVTEVDVRTFSPTVMYSGGGYVMAYQGSSLIRGLVKDSIFDMNGYVGIATLSTSPTPSGNVTIGIGIANNSPQPIPVTVSRAGSAGSGVVAGLINPGDSFIQLLLENSGAIANLTAGAAPAGARFYFSAKIPINP